MSDKTKIEWTDTTWNPVRGCSRVSKGCEHCYAEGVARRFAGPGQPYEGLVRLDANGKAKAQWNGQVRFVAEHLADPLRWRKPRRVFVNSMSDLFHEALSFEQIAAVFGVMAAAPQHTFQVLTKRPARARDFMRWVHDPPSGDLRLDRLPLDAYARGMDWPLPNVWLGVSVEDQATADSRIPVLLDTPAAVRWVSYEPALGPVEWTDAWLTGRGFGASLDWIVVGGESGPGARPFDVAWARSTIAACRAFGVPVFVKQLGANVLRSRCRDCADNDGLCEHDGIPCGGLAHAKGGEMGEWPDDLRVREWPASHGGAS